MAVEVPMSHPAIAGKNPDGTWSVRIQHTAGGSVTTVDFTNVLFAETLAKGYAAMLNGTAAIETKFEKLADDIGPAVADVKADVSKLFETAEEEAKKLITAAKNEASLVRAEADGYAASVKKTIDTAYTDAKIEAEKLVTEAREKASDILAKASAKVAPADAKLSKAAKSSTVEEE